MTTTNLPENLIATLSGDHYTDPEIFRLEQERVFESMWFYVARSAPASAPTDPGSHQRRARMPGG